jgi:hypothetical protein
MKKESEIRKVCNQMIDRMNKYIDEATVKVSTFSVTETELLAALLFSTKGDFEKASKIYSHEEAHYVTSVMLGYKPVYTLNFQRKSDGKVNFYPGVFSKPPAWITVPQHFKAMMAISVAPEDPSPIDMENYRGYEELLTEAEKLKNVKLKFAKAWYKETKAR